MKTTIAKQVQKNRDAYKAIQSRMETEHLGKSVLMHNGEVSGIYDTSSDAYAIGCEKFGLGRFTTELVGQRPVHLGIHSLGLSPDLSNADI